MIQKYPFKNLVFKGGGVKAFAYHGAMLVLEEEKILPQIDRLAGTSAGAFLSTLLSLRLGALETIDLYKTIDYDRVAGMRSVLKSETGTEAGRFLERGMTTRLLDSIDAVQRFLRSYGWYENDYPHAWLQEIIAEYNKGNGRATFADFRKFGYRDLHIVATNITKHKIVVFSADSTPDVSVADAVLMSSSLPFYYEAVQFDGKNFGSGDYYVDGGMLINYPLHIYDDLKYKRDNRNYLHGINWETLGCRLYTPEDRPPTEKPINSLLGYIENLLETVVEIQGYAYENSLVDQMRSISINNCGVSTTDLSIRPHEEDPTYTKMVKAGQTAARAYLDSYRLPTDRFYDIKSKFAEFLEQRS